ncbi:hypothetical protein C5B42_05090 [Candidatus Cerribacteria bacterium 'Amazon FNV 2010 28 9']|uniref:Uncharacterized protein n=1 Tax=Candidatus Cerribacteria bacterium 'Amazon FNV 2010 28 9' TaxID=2081795 RepID=A0A317JMQ5_9BACT|nr:MAG: hypothetical protein C5B42_05090 [Candidatus Cerribacteria bacterium 'Amazon FNV 2010 28 9']
MIYEIRNDGIQTYWHKLGVSVCIVFLSLISYIISLPFASQAYAQSSGIDISISPPFSIVQTHGTDPLTVAITIHNSSTNDLTITPTLHPFSSDQVSGNPVIDTQHSIDFATIQTPGFTLGQAFSLTAGQEQQLVLHIIPPTTFKTDANLAFTAFAQPNVANMIGSGAQTQANAIIGSLIILEAQPQNISAPLALEKLDGPNFIDMFSLLSLTLSAHNDDATLHQIRGTLVLKNGQSVHTLYSLFPDFILAQSSRRVRAMTEENGEKQTLTTQFTGPFLPGAYTVEVTLTQGNSPPKVYTKTVYVFPFTLMLAVLLIASVLYILKVLHIHNRSKA